MEATIRPHPREKPLPSGATEATHTEVPTPTPSLGSRAVRWLLTLSVLVGGLWLVVANGVGMGLAVDTLVRSAAPSQWQIRYATVRGDWRTHISIVGLEIEAPRLTFTADSVSVTYRLTDLLRRTVHLSRVLVSRPAAILVSSPAPAPERAPRSQGADPDTATSSALDALLHGSLLGGWSLQADVASVEAGTVATTTPRSEVSASGIHMLASLRTGPEDGFVVTVDELEADLAPPSAPGGAPLIPDASDPPADARLDFSGSWRNGVASIRRLSLETPRSSISGSGSLPLLATPAAAGSAARRRDRSPVSPDLSGPESPGTDHQIDFRLSADPLDLRDVPVVLPGWMADHPVGAVELVASGRLDSTSVQGSIDGFADATVQVDGRLRGGLDSFLATLRVSHGDVGPLGSASLDVQKPDARWALDLRLDEAAARGSGTLRWQGPQRAVRVDTLRLRRIDAHEVAPQLPVTSISGLVTADVSGTSVDDASGRISIDLAPSVVSEMAIDTAALRVVLDSAAAWGRVEARASRARLAADFRLERPDSVVQGRLSDLDLVVGSPAGGTEAASAPPPRSLSTVAGDVVGPSMDEPTAALRGDATFRLVRSSPRQGSATLILEESSVGAASLPEAEVRLRLDGQNLGGTGKTRVEGITDAPLAVTAELDASGVAGEDLQGRLEATAIHPRASGEDRDGAADTLRVAIRAQGNGSYPLDGRLRVAEGGVVDLDGTLALDGPFRSARLQLDGSLDSATALLGGAAVDSLSATVTASQGGAGPFDVQTEIAAAGARWRQVTADSLVLRGAYDGGGILVDTLGVQGNALSLTGAGRIPRTAGTDTIRLRGTLTDSEPFRAVAGAEVLRAEEGAFDLLAVGSLDSLDVRATGSLAAIVFNELRLSGLEASGRASVTGGALVDTGFDLSLDRLTLPEAEVRRIDVAGGGGPDSVGIEASAVVDQRRTGELRAVLDPRPDRRSLRVDRLDAQLDRDEWSLAHPATLSYRDGLAVDSFDLRAGDSRVFVDGGLAADGALNLVVDVDSTDIGTTTDIAGVPALRGWIQGRLALHGSRRAPRGTVDVHGAFRRRDGEFGPATMELQLEGQRMRGSVELEDADGGLLSLTGSSPVPFSALSPDSGARARPAADSLELRLTSEDFDLGWMLPFVDEETLTALEGPLEGSMSIAGTTDRPSFGGALRVSDGSADLPELGVSYDDIRAHISGADSLLRLDSARVDDASGGRMTVTGDVVPGASMAIDGVIDLDGFQVIASPAYDAVVSGRLEATGSATRPVLDGDLRLESLDVYLDQRGAAGGDLETVELTEEDLRMLRERFGYVPPHETDEPALSQRVTASVAVEVGRDSWLRKEANPEMAIPFTGDLTVGVEPGLALNVDGELETIPDRGFIEQFGRRFTLGQGTVVLDGAPGDAELDVEATYTIPSHDNPDDAEATIILDVRGTRDDLSLELSSNPPMENADIVSYIATGRPAASSLSFSEGESGGLASVGTELALNQITGAVEGAAQRNIGLDVVEIRREGFREATLVAGSYVSPRLYVGFAQPVSLQEDDELSIGADAGSEVEIELEALRWLLINIEGSSSAVRFFLRGRHAY